MSEVLSQEKFGELVGEDLPGEEPIDEEMSDRFMDIDQASYMEQWVHYVEDPAVCINGLAMVGEYYENLRRDGESSHCGKLILRYTCLLYRMDKACKEELHVSKGRSSRVTR